MISVMIGPSLRFRGFPHPLGRFKILMLFVGWLGALPLGWAAIVPTGDVVPTYMGADPWLILGELAVADSGDGTLLVNVASVVQSMGGILGFNPGVLGTVQVMGAGSEWDNSAEVTVGGNGNGSLQVQQGATVRNTDASIGHFGGDGNVLVEDSGSKWISSGALTIGNTSFGVLSIGAQGMVQSESAWIGFISGALGQVTVDGQQSVWEIGQTLKLGDSLDSGAASLSLSSSTGSGSRVYVGDAAPAVGSGLALSETALVIADSAPETIGMSIYSGNTVQNAGNSYIGPNAGQAGQVHVSGSGSLWSNDGTLQVGGDGSGVLTLEAGGQVSAAGGVTVGFSGSLLGNGTVSADLVNGGLVVPGLLMLPTSNTSIGSLAIAGNYLQAPTGKIQMELAGTTLGQWDTIAISGGSATLDGTLEVLLDAPGGTPFVPQLDDTFEVLTATDGLTGTFINPILPALNAGLGWLIDYGPAEVKLTVISQLEADFDYNGTVGSADLALWDEHFGDATGAVKATGDADLDGDTDGSDFMIWQQQFGSSALPASSPAVTAIPEPVSIWLVAMGLLGVGRGRHYT
jgi:T5SS/PEP-CTERM-associated repeat protein